MKSRADTATADLFAPGPCASDATELIAPGAMLLRGFAHDDTDALLDHVARIAAAAPFRQMETPGGFRMSVAMTNCGTAGWITDRRGYRYDAIDPVSGRPWPALPKRFGALAARAALAAGFPDFAPDACLINRYAPGARMSLHQDKNERDLTQPIVSISLGLPATFLFGGLKRSDRPTRLRLASGDVVVWGGPARMAFHGIDPLPSPKAPGSNGPDSNASASGGPLMGAYRINLTLRRAL